MSIWIKRRDLVKSRLLRQGIFSAFYIDRRNSREWALWSGCYLKWFDVFLGDKVVAQYTTLRGAMNSAADMVESRPRIHHEGTE